MDVRGGSTRLEQKFHLYGPVYIRIPLLVRLDFHNQTSRWAGLRVPLGLTLDCAPSLLGYTGVWTAISGKYTMHAIPESETNHILCF